MKNFGRLAMDLNFSMSMGVKINRRMDRAGTEWKSPTDLWIVRRLSAGEGSRQRVSGGSGRDIRR